MLAGEAGWLAGNAARVGARAEAVGADPEAAARSALPAHLRHGLRVSRDDGAVKVRVRLPIVMRGWGSPVRIGATAGLPRRERSRPGKRGGDRCAVCAGDRRLRCSNCSLRAATAAIADGAAEAAAIAVVNGQDPEEAARAAAPGWARSRVHVREAGWARAGDPPGTGNPARDARGAADLAEAAVRKPAAASP